MVMVDLIVQGIPRSPLDFPSRLRHTPPEWDGITECTSTKQVFAWASAEDTTQAQAARQISYEFARLAACLPAFSAATTRVLYQIEGPPAPVRPWGKVPTSTSKLLRARKAPVGKEEDVCTGAPPRRRSRLAPQTLQHLPRDSDVEGHGRALCSSTSPLTK